jgi:outer membrane protein OmpA-like peptidoglycan-associated protein
MGPSGFQPEGDARGFDDVRQRRREYNEGGRTFISEPGRTIIRDRDRVYIRHDEVERFRDLGGPVRTERRGRDNVTIVERPGGEQIVTIVDEDGRLLRRTRRSRDGREVVIIDNTFRGPPRAVDEEIVDLPPPDIRIPRDRYIVDAEGASEDVIYEALSAPPIGPITRRYTLDEVRSSSGLRARMRSVDLDTINFETGSWEVTSDQAQRLATIARAVNQTIQKNPSEVFLIEGHTDAVGSDVDNLSLSDRRAQSVAEILTRDFRVPPENLTTQGYGEGYLKVNTQAASRENRRVTARRITPLLNGQGGPAQ